MVLSISGDVAKQEVQKRKANVQAKVDANVSATKKSKHEIEDDDKAAYDDKNSKVELTKNAGSKRKANQLAEAPKTKIPRHEDVENAASDGKILMDELKRKTNKPYEAPQAKKSRRGDIVDVSNDAKIPDGKSGHNMRTRSRAVKPSAAE